MAMTLRTFGHAAMSPHIIQKDVNDTLYRSVLYNPSATATLLTCASTHCAQGIMFSPDSSANGATIVRVNWLSIKPNTCTKFNSFRAPDDIATYEVDGVVMIDSHTDGKNCQGQAPAGTIYPLKKFLYVYRSQIDPAAFMPLSGAELAIGGKDIEVIVAVNLMHKAATGWQWSTFWWTSTHSPGDNRAGLQCTDTCLTTYTDVAHPMDFSNYVMNFVPANLAPADKFIAVSNPYLDAKSGIATNCIVCHSFAMTPMPKYGAGLGGGTGTPHAISCGAQDAQSLSKSTLKPVLLDYKTSQTIGCPSGHRLETDMVWTVAKLQKALCGDRNCTVPSGQ